MRQTNKNRRTGGTITQRIRALFSSAKPKHKVATPPPKEPTPPPKEPTLEQKYPTPQFVSEKIEIEDVNRIIKKVLHEEGDIKISKPVRNYLVKLANTKPVDEIKRIDKIEDDNILGFGFSVTDSNKDILLRILEEIITLSINRTRDSRLKMVSEKIITATLNIKENEYIKRLVV